MAGDSFLVVTQVRLVSFSKPHDGKNLDKQLLSGLSVVGVPKELQSTAIPFGDGDIETLESTLAKGDVAAIKMEVMRSKSPSLNYRKIYVVLLININVY